MKEVVAEGTTSSLSLVRSSSSISRSAPICYITMIGVGGITGYEFWASGISWWASSSIIGRWATDKGLVLGLFFLGGEANSKRFPALNPSFLARMRVHLLTVDSTTRVADFLDLLLV